MASPRRRLAIASPWPPQQSGIADYAAEQVAALAAHHDLVLYAEGAALAAGGTLCGHPVHPLAELPARRRAGEHDAVLYHLGNDPRFHAGIYRLLPEVPGILVLHEFVVHHLIQGLTHGAGRTADYVAELAYAYGPTGESFGRRFAASGVTVDPWSYPLFERAVDAAVAVVVHSEESRRRVLTSRPDARVFRIPHHLSLDALPAGLDRAAARRELGLPAAVPVVASFGYMTLQKRLGVALRAFARLRHEVPEAVYLIAGEVAPELRQAPELVPLLAGAGVHVLGRLELDRFLAAMLACDVAVNLRFPSGGETSGTLIRLLGLGRAVVVSDHGSFQEVPDDACVKVPLDGDEEDLLAAALVRLCRDEPLRRALGENARQEIASHHALATTAAAYAEVVEQAVAAGWGPLAPPATLQPQALGDPVAAAVGSVGGALFDLGVSEADDDLLVAVAPALADLGLA